MSKFEILCVTMKQRDFSKLNEMNIHSDVIFANQADTTEYKSIEFDGHTAQMITTATRGVGINRNIALNYSDGDILLMADDDMQYVDNYEELILEAFQKVPQADALIFNIETIGADMGRRKNETVSRVRFINALNYGAVRIAVKRKKLLAANIRFSLCFGGGTMYSAGEDTIFICDMLKKLKIYTYPLTIATVDQSDSTWFKGYTCKYFYDKGALFCAISEKGALLLCLQDLLRHKKIYSEANMPFRTMLGSMRKGMQGYKELIAYSDMENTDAGN